MLADESVKPTDTLDFVNALGEPSTSDRHSSWPRVAPWLGATYPLTLLLGAVSGLAPTRSTYLVLLRVEIARFTRILASQNATRLCCSNPHLTVERCYLLRCPSAVQTFLQCCVSTNCTSGGLVDFTGLIVEPQFAPQWADVTQTLRQSRPRCPLQPCFWVARPPRVRPSAVAHESWGLCFP